MTDPEDSSRGLGHEDLHTQLCIVLGWAHKQLGRPSRFPPEMVSDLAIRIVGVWDPAKGPSADSGVGPYCWKWVRGWVNRWYYRQGPGAWKGIEEFSDRDIRTVALHPTLLTSREDASPLEDVMRAEQREYIYSILDTLTKRDREIVLLYYGFNGCTYTLEEIGQRFNCCRENIRALLQSAVTRLRRRIGFREATVEWDTRDEPREIPQPVVPQDWDTALMSDALTTAFQQVPPDLNYWEALELLQSLQWTTEHARYLAREITSLSFDRRRTAYGDGTSVAAAKQAQLRIHQRHPDALAQEQAVEAARRRQLQDERDAREKERLDKAREAATEAGRALQVVHDAKAAAAAAERQRREAIRKATATAKEAAQEAVRVAMREWDIAHPHITANPYFNRNSA